MGPPYRRELPRPHRGEAPRLTVLGLAVGLCLLATPGCRAQGPSSSSLEPTTPVFFAMLVPDDGAAAAWYGRVFGLEEVRHLEVSERGISIRLLAGAGLNVEVIRRPGTEEAGAAPAVGLFKTGFYVRDIETAYDWLQEQGVDADGTIFTDDALRARSFVFRDLNGNRIQLFQACGEGCEGP